MKTPFHEIFIGVARCLIILISATPLAAMTYFFFPLFSR